MCDAGAVRMRIIPPMSAEAKQISPGHSKPGGRRDHTPPFCLLARHPSRERAMGFEPMTFSLARRYSTTELRPLKAAVLYHQPRVHASSGIWWGKNPLRRFILRRQRRSPDAFPVREQSPSAPQQCAIPLAASWIIRTGSYAERGPTVFVGPRSRPRSEAAIYFLGFLGFLGFFPVLTDPFLVI